jgi:CRP-like cAMP-binding protein
MQRTAPMPRALLSTALGATPADPLLALDRLGTRLGFPRGRQIFVECDAAEHMFKVLSGAVRVCKVLPDGRRHIASFHFAGDFFGFEDLTQRHHTAEAIGDVVVMRYPRLAIEHAATSEPALARQLRQMALDGLAAAHQRMLCLGRKTATERVVSFVLDMAERVGIDEPIELPMSRYDIADYLGLTIETVSRVLGALRRAGAISVPQAQRIDIRDRAALEGVGLAA